MPGKVERRVVKLSVPTFTDTEHRAVMRVLRSGHVTQGARVREFEAAFLKWVGAGGERAACMVNSGSSANLLAAALLQKIGRVTPERTEVVMPAVAWSTTVAPFIQHGFKPVFVDVGPDCTMDVKAAAAAVGSKTAGIVTVDLLGHPSDVLGLASLGVPVVEDACEALGARRGGAHVGMGPVMAATFSTFFSHHCSTIEGGMLVYPKEQYEVLSFREHGWIRGWPQMPAQRIMDEFPDVDPRFMFAELGYNVRSTELNAAIGLWQLKKQAHWAEHRRRTAAWFREHLKHPTLRLVSLPDGAVANPFSFPIVVAPDASFTRADLVAWLEDHGVETRPVMSGNMTRQPWYVRNPTAWRAEGSLDRANALHERGFLIPCHQKLTLADLQHIEWCFNSFLVAKGLGELN